MFPIAILTLLLGCSGESAHTPPSPASPAAVEATVEDAEADSKSARKTNKITTVNEVGLDNLLKSKPDTLQVISFWATWCTPCIVEIVLLNALATIHKEVDFILVNIDHPSMLERRVVPFLRERQLNQVTLYHLDHPDPNVALGEVVPNWPDSIPVTFIKDKTGIIRDQFNTNISREQLEEALERASH